MAAGAQLQPYEHKREEQGSRGGRILPLYLATSMGFLLLASVLGAWSVISISPPVAQAHGHLEVVGLMGSLFLGFGFYWLRHWERAQAWAWVCWGLWVAGAGLRCVATSSWHWRTLLPASAGLELSATLIFAAVVGAHVWRRRLREERDISALLLLSANLGLLLAGIGNLAAALSAAHREHTPAFEAGFDQRLTILYTWGFVAPLAWGIAARWLPRLMSLKPVRSRLMLAACALNLAGIAAALAARIHLAAVLLLHAAIFLPSSLRVFAKSEGQNRMRSGPFARIAFVWLRVAATLGVWASVNDAGHIWGSSRHALLIGFVLTLVLFMADALQLVAKSHLAMRSMALLNLGCLLHVISELLMHERMGTGARYLLALGGGLELLAVAMFVVNIALAGSKLMWSEKLAMSPE